MDVGIPAWIFCGNCNCQSLARKNGGRNGISGCCVPRRDAVSGYPSKQAAFVFHASAAAGGGFSGIAFCSRAGGIGQRPVSGLVRSVGRGDSDDAVHAIRHPGPAFFSGGHFSPAAFAGSGIWDAAFLLREKNGKKTAAVFFLHDHCGMFFGKLYKSNCYQISDENFLKGKNKMLRLEKRTYRYVADVDEMPKISLN